MNNEEICGEKKKEKVHIIKSGNRGKDGERGEKIVVKWWRGLNGGGQVRETTVQGVVSGPAPRYHVSFRNYYYTLLPTW